MREHFEGEPLPLNCAGERLLLSGFWISGTAQHFRWLFVPSWQALRASPWTRRGGGCPSASAQCYAFLLGAGPGLCSLLKGGRAPVHCCFVWVAPVCLQTGKTTSFFMLFLWTTISLCLRGATWCHRGQTAALPCLLPAWDGGSKAPSRMQDKH